MVQFFIDQLNNQFTGQSSTAVPSYDAAAVYTIKLSTVLNTFKFQINETLSDSMRYYVDMDGWDVGSVNAAHAMMNHSLSENMFGENYGYSDEYSLLKHDIIRYMADETFNSHILTSLISNIDDIKEEVEQLGHNHNDTIELMLEDVSLSGEHSDLVDPDGTGENQYLTNSNTTTTNVVRCILKMIQLEDPGRLIDISNNSDIQSVPFKVNDQLVYAITYNFNNFTPRTYLIRLLIVADENVENTVVQDGILYPYDYPYAE